MSKKNSKKKEEAVPSKAVAEKLVAVCWRKNSSGGIDGISANGEVVTSTKGVQDESVDEDE